MKRFDTQTNNPEEIRLKLARPLIEEASVSPAVALRLQEIFGRPVTPLEAVHTIIGEVETHGDAAVIDFTERIDGVKLSPEHLFADEEEIEQARQIVRGDDLKAVRHAIDRIRKYHEAQVDKAWFIQGPGGEILGQRVLPLERVACYVPAGRAPLVSSAIMSVVPATVAGVSEVVVATPPGPDGKANPYVLVAALEAGAHRVLKVGGAQAVAALAYGTTWIPKVDKIVGPGNIFVTLAKKAVFGRVGIDGLNGPSELAVVADDSVDPSWVAVDLVSQAEHDPEAQSLLFTADDSVADRVLEAVEEVLSKIERSDIARESLDRWGAAVVCRDLDEAFDWLNVAASEHVQLMIREPWQWLERVQFAGAVFLGPWSTVPSGDFIAGPNHILPTHGTARFASPLGVYDFVRRSGIVSLTEGALKNITEDGARIARLEGLGAHADAMERRFDRS